MPLLIRWMARAEPPKKRTKRGPGRPRKIQRETELEIIEIDPESDESDGNGVHTGDGELPSLQKTKRPYTLRQNKRVVAVVRQESKTVASMVGYQIRWYT